MKSQDSLTFQNNFQSKQQTMIISQNQQKQEKIKFQARRDTQKREKKILLLRRYIKQILKKKQNIEFDEGLSNLKKNNMQEDFCDGIFVSRHQCFSYFNAALQNSRSLRFLDISGLDIDPLLAIELGQSIQKNSSLYEIDLSGCNLNTSSLQYIFSSISNHQTLQSINLFNNQGFSNDLVNDISQFLFKGKNNLKKLKLTHCNIPSTAMSLLLRNLKYSNSINSLDISMMDFTTDALTSLGIALQHYKGDKILQQLNISYSNIKNQGMAVLAQRVSWSFRKINLKELNLSRNFISQQGVEHLESFLGQINQLQRLDLSLNQIEEFNCLDLLKRPLYEINLCSNLFSYFPEYFFVNTLVVNLSNNNIQCKGAFQLSSILRQNPMWIELNLSNNQLLSEGFNSLIFGLRDNTMLKKLIVSNNGLDGEAIITYMINHEQVNFECLDISFNCIRYVLIYYMLNFIKGGRLKSLKCNNLQFKSNSEIINQQIRFEDNQNDIHENNFLLDQAQENFKYVQFQLSSFNLREVDFSNNSYIFSPVVNSLAHHFNKIEILNLSNCQPITDLDIDSLSLFVEKSSMLHDLNLSNLGLGYRAFESLNRLRRAILISNIKSLNMSGNQLFKSINNKVENCEIIFNYKIESIDYSHNGIEATHVFYIEAVLFSYKNLKELNLSYNSIDFVGLITIMKYINQNIPLQKLNLSNQKLRADDLLIISHFLGNEYQNLIYLNLANNNSIKRMKLFYNLCSSQKLNSLNLSQIYFDQSNIQKTIEIIQKQKKNISEVILDYCNFTQNGYRNLMSELIKCKKLYSFSINYNPFIHVDLDKSSELLISMKNLKIMKFHQITFVGNAFKLVSDWLSNPDMCSIQTIYLSQSVIKQEWMDDIMQGVEKNTSLKNLLLNHCSLGRLNLTKLWRAIAVNESLQVVSLKQNHLTYHLEQFEIAFQQAPKQTYLNELNLSNNFITPLSFAHLITSNSSIIIRQINLTQCCLSQNHFSNLESFFSKINNNITILQNIQCLTLAENKLCDKASSNLAKLLSYMTCLEQVNLSQNLLTSNGSIEIVKSILDKESLNLLNLSQNKIDDQLANFILELNQNLKMKFLILRYNAFSSNGQKQLVKILHKYETLFIDNMWKEIDDKDSEIILNQYSKVGQRYRLKQDLLPQFLKEINLQNSNLTDKFCEIFGKYFPLLQFIEIIDISDNPFITMYGKTCLFFVLFDLSFEQHKLKVMNITDSKEIRKFYDDGLLRYIILRFRNFLLPFNTTKVTQQINAINQSEKTKQQIFGGMFGSFILHKINKLLFYLDLFEPPTFIVSTLFIRKFRRNNLNIKLLITLFWIVFICIGLMQYRNMTVLSKYNFKSCQLGQVLDGQCTLINPNTLNDFYFSFSCLAIITFFDLLQLLLTVTMRQKIHPALQIVHPSILYNLHSKFPTKQEILWMLFSIFTKFYTLPERIFLPQILVIDGSVAFIKNYQIVFSILIIGRGLDQIIVSLINFINFIKANPRNDQAKYLSLLQRNLYDMNYYAPSEILASFCPIQGYQVSKPVKINFQIIIEAFRMIIFEIPLFVMIWRFCDKPEVQHSLFDFSNSNQFKFLLTIIFFKSLVSIIISTIKILTVRPSIVKQHGFNQAFSIKQFIKSKSQFVKPQDLKVEETIQQLIQESYTKRVQVLNSVKQLEQKNSSDQIISENDEKIRTPQKQEIFSNSSLSELDSPQSPFKLEQPKFKYNT